MRARLKVGAVVAVVVLVVVGAVSLYRSSIFAVSSVEVVGNEQLSTDQVLERAAVPADATLLRFPADEVRERLVSDPWISDAVVTRDFPDTMRIRLTERVPAAYVDVGEEAFWLVDLAGFAIARQTPDTTATLVVVRDIEDAALEAGARSESETLLNALRVWQGLSSDLAAQVRAVSAPTVDKTTLITVDDIEILVGSADDIGKKDLIAREILREHAGVVVYVNVRTVDRPTWRGLDE